MDIIRPIRPSRRMKAALADFARDIFKLDRDRLIEVLLDCFEGDYDAIQAASFFGRGAGQKRPADSGRTSLLH